jgi:hypothetical protein
VTKPDSVQLGFEIPTGEPVIVPLAHMCVTGQTQLSGKTTTLEAMVARSGMPAIAFITKRGEGSFSLMNGMVSGYQVREIAPFFKHRADWKFVSDILGAILSEKLKFQRPWIMQVCRGAQSLREVHEKVKLRLHGDKRRKIKPARGLAESVYTELDEYFEMLLPELEQLPYVNMLDLGDGMNIMDLSEYSLALQMLVVSSVMEEIYERYTGVLTVIPEAWEFIPNGKSSPAKSAAISLIRKGAVLRNFILADSQDLASIDTEVRRAMGVWILGVQREQNEVKRAISHIPAGTKRPKLEDMMHLEKGQFFVCHGKEVRKVYVWPAWMSEVHARAVAMGELELGSVPIEANTAVTWKTRRLNSKTGATKDIVAGDVVLTEEQKPQTMGFRGMDYHTDPDAPPDTVLLIDPTRLPPINPDDYHRIPEGLPYYINQGAADDPNRRQDPGFGRPPAINIPPHHSKVANQKETPDMDQKEREQYEGLVKELRLTVIRLKLRLGLELSTEESFLWSAESPDARTVTEPHTHARIVEDAGGERARPLTTNDLQMITDHVLSRMPSHGVIKVEPREVVLKEFERAEVERILEQAEARSVWQKQVIRLLEAKGAPLQKSAIVIAITGRKTVNMPRDFKIQYDEIDELAALGFVTKHPKNGIYPNLSATIAKRLAEFEASDAEVANVVGQVILRLK